jgi:GINS complex subunit 1
MNYAQHGRTLLVELKRSDTDIPSYNNTAVAHVLQDIRLHAQALGDQVAPYISLSKPSMNVRPSMLLQEAAIQRNKQCLLAYHKVRCDRIQSLCFWKQQALQQQLSPAEVDFFNNYQQLVHSYTQELSLSSDSLRMFAVPPQPCDHVQVRVLQEQGHVVLESGATVMLTKGSTQFLLWSDVEEYIRNGILRVVDGEEE